jgi:hypothetical protein
VPLSKIIRHSCEVTSIKAKPSVRNDPHGRRRDYLIQGNVTIDFHPERDKSVRKFLCSDRQWSNECICILAQYPSRGAPRDWLGLCLVNLRQPAKRGDLTGWNNVTSEGPADKL